MLLKEVLDSTGDLDSFVGEEIIFRDINLGERVIKAPSLRLTRHQIADCRARFYFDRLEGPIEFLTDSQPDNRLVYLAACLAYTYSRRSSKTG